MMLAIPAFLVLFPFLVEAWVTSGVKTNPPARSLAFYWLTPLASLTLYGFLLTVFSFPVFSLFIWFVVFAGISAISNKKEKILSQPFLIHDFENARHLFIYPDFYVSHVGWPRVLAILAAVAIVAATAFATETAIVSRQDLIPPLLAWLSGVIFVFGLLVGTRRAAQIFMRDRIATDLGLSLNPCEDVARFGLWGTMILYYLMRQAPRQSGPAWGGREAEIEGTPADIIAIQGESFFNLNRYFETLSDAHTDSWMPIRHLTQKGVRTAPLTVPAWGAFTMQTEFSFLTGMQVADLGIDYHNPYERIAQDPVWSFAHALKAAGYRTVCVHPAKKGFFRRLSVIPNLGFDEFIGLEDMKNPDFYGQYVSDKYLGETINQLVAEHHAASDVPLFVFAITIESHGPWQAGRLAAHLNEQSLEEDSPSQDREFSLFNIHMDNMMAMFDDLIGTQNQARERVVALYGDHQPALESLFSRTGFKDKSVDYMIWHSGSDTAAPEGLDIAELGEHILKHAGVRLSETPPLKDS